MKSALLTVLGLKLTSSLHFEGTYNSDISLLKNYLSNVHQTAMSSLMAAHYLTPALEFGAKHLIEGTLVSKDVSITYQGEGKKGDLFHVNITVPCFDYGLYVDYLSNEISSDDRHMVENSLFIDIGMSVDLDLATNDADLNLHSMIFQDLNVTNRCLLSDTLDYCYDSNNDPMAFLKKLCSSMNLFDFISVEYFNQQKMIKILDLA